MEIWTAAILNHKYARFLLAIFIENGLIPNSEILTKLMSPGGKFEYITYLVDP